MNRIVKEHYPVDRLPDDLRQGLEPGAQITITIVEEEALSERPLSLDELFAMRRPPFRSGEEIDAELERQRDEWGG